VSELPNNGGAAFPDPCGAHPGAFPPDQPKGMTLRDYFAAKAMAAILRLPDKIYTDALIAKYSYNMADTMIYERENGGAK